MTAFTDVGGMIGSNVGSYAGGAVGGAVGELFGPEAVPLGAWLGSRAGAYAGGLAGQWAASKMQGADDAARPKDAAKTDGKSENCPNCDECKQANSDIDRATQKLKDRYQDMESDRYGMKQGAAPSGKGDWDGHVQAYEEAQNRLKKLIKKAKNKNCNISPEPEEWQDKPPPSQDGGVS